uniref:Transmembrane protein n=1 Tax=Rhabditophanes sp. KR3021 TaxID=114890 RepID=A0AC35U9T3_9BILA
MEDSEQYWLKKVEDKEECWLSYGIQMTFRFIWSSFLIGHLFDFMFSAIWMHGYVWALNQYIDIDLSEKSTVVIVEHHLKVVGIKERILHSILISSAVLGMCLMCKYHRVSQNIWKLLRLSMALGALCGLSRCCQMKQRLYPALHEIFYSYLAFFISGVCFLVQFDDLTLRKKEKRE